MFDHLSLQDVWVCLFGVLMFWFFRFSSEKDEFDKIHDKSFSPVQWVKDWVWFRFDNIICHLLASAFFLYLGEENLEAWIGDLATQLPDNANALGSAGMIGFFGSFIAEGLKKVIKLIKT